MTLLLHTEAQLTADREQFAAAQPAGRIAFVPTMGALHEGHLSLVRLAREHADRVVVSVFVNPTQFGAGEDFDRYPRTLDADVAALDGLADVVFAPAVAEVYPHGFDGSGKPVGIPFITAGSAAAHFEGAVRPGHFDGMLTVVNRLFDMVRPDVAVFGQKDAQQIFHVRDMIARDRLPIELVIGRTAREDDGLARSSRNRYLSAAERDAAVVMPTAIYAVQAAAHGGAEAARAAGHAVFEAQPLAKLDYLELVNPQTFVPVMNGYTGPATVIVAARLGTTRLLDTEDITLG